ncbi:MAG TPA: fumarylacetoacetate hydrolase family protein [Candidatus Limnocylindrales bacterium]|jgi:2-dehydro-3-deoxy-D-arabinonate dehydratase
MTTRALFRLRLPDGTIRLAIGSPDEGPATLLDPEASLDAMLAAGGGRLWDEVAAATGTDDVPEGARLLAPIETQPVWAAGVTYERSRVGREAESLSAADVYSLVYDAERPELFFKSTGDRAVGPGDAIGVRRDSAWNAPEPELVVVVDADMRPVGFTVGNDASSRSIEGENPLYLPQAKVYERSCALGPCVVAWDDLALPAAIRLSVERGGGVAYEGETSTAVIHRRLEDLVDWLGRALTFDRGAFLMTGTGIVPPESFTLTAGDEVVIEIEGIGVLRNPVIDVGRV